MLQKIKIFWNNAQDYSTHEFLIYLCINFSFLFNGIFLVFIGEFPVFLENAPENTFRINSGCFCIAIWFLFLPILSRNAKDKIIHHFIYSLLTLVSLIIIVSYWLNLFYYPSFIIWDILIILISIPTVSYLFYLLVNLFKLIFFVIKKIINAMLPELNEKKGLLFTLEAITSIFVGLSSIIAAFWGIITAIKTIF